MADPFTLTPQPIWLSAPTKQTLDQALEVSAWDSVSALLSVLAIQGSGTPTATFRIITGMQKDTDDGWVELTTFTATSSGNSYEAKHVDNQLLRYIRWELVSLSGTTPSVLFTLTGMLRTLS